MIVSNYIDDNVSNLWQIDETFNQNIVQPEDVPNSEERIWRMDRVMKYRSEQQSCIDTNK